MTYIPSDRSDCSTKEVNIQTHVICSLLDSVANLWIHAIANVNKRRRLLEDTKGLDEGFWQALRGTTDVEILQ